MSRVALLVLVISACSRSGHVRRGTVSGASVCAGAPTDRGSEEWSSYSASRQRVEESSLFQYAQKKFGKPVDCAWQSDGPALNRILFQDRFTFTFPHQHQMEVEHDGDVKTTS